MISSFFILLFKFVCVLLCFCPVCHRPFICAFGDFLQIVLDQLSAQTFPEQFVGTTKGMREGPKINILQIPI